MDVVDFARYVAALAVVLGLLGLLALGVRHGWLTSLIARAGAAAGGGGGSGRPKRRLAVTESLVLDPRRRVVVMRCEDEEFVLLLGAGAEMVLDRRPVKPPAKTDAAA
ncbi:MAG: flagellar biosynthetic protein FliO [Maricaulaceae bacterium]|nr:flagellar biosynthetic protein FliO [Maricaulaceae bacterium]